VHDSFIRIYSLDHDVWKEIFVEIKFSMGFFQDFIVQKTIFHEHDHHLVVFTIFNHAVVVKIIFHAMV